MAEKEASHASHTSHAADTTKEAAKTAPKAGGCGPMFIFVVLILIVGAILGGNEGFGLYGAECGDMDPFECAEYLSSDEGDEPAEGTVTASGPYSYKGHDVVITLNIPLKGGTVTGNISGACNGQVRDASFNGADNGVVSGRLAGTCEVFLFNVPAKATFSGTVNKTSKTVPVSFDGGGGGITHSGSLSLAW